MSAEALVLDVLTQLLDLDDQQLAPELELAALPGWDSVNALRVLMFLERQAGAALDFEAYSAGRTLADLIAVTEQALSIVNGSPA
jgi:acyl carrier protein